MRPSVRMFWRSLHEPRVVTLVTMICYATLCAFGVYNLFHPNRGPAPFWQISAVSLAIFSPVAFVAAWRGTWQVERPVLYGVSGGLLLSVLCYLYTDSEVTFRFAHIVMIVVSAQAFVSRWVRIKTSYESPARIAEKYKKSLDNRND